MYDTLVGFHVTPGYLAHYEQVVARIDSPSAEVRYGIQIVDARAGWASVLEDALARGDLRLRPIHGDPKINNFMIDDVTGQAISLVDLDTVKPGLVHYDIGDCLRSCCNSLGEETERINEVCFDTDLCRAILEGCAKPLAEGLKVESDMFGEVCKTEDMKIGVKNFLEKGPRSKAEFVHR